MRNITLSLIIAILIITSVFATLSLTQFNQITEIKERNSNLQQSIAEYQKEVTELRDNASALKREVVTAALELQQSRNTTRPLLENNLLEIVSLRQRLEEKNSDYTRLKKMFDETAKLLNEIKEDLLKIQAANEELEAEVKRLRSQPRDGQINPFDLQPLHNFTSGLTNRECLQCHMDRLYDLRHRAHIENPLLNFSCLNCHEKIDLSLQWDPLIVGVNRTKCAKCHTPMPDKFGMSRLKSDQFARVYPKCERCHTDWKTKMEDVGWYINLDNISESDCYKCHGRIALFDQPKTTPITIPCVMCH